MWASRRSASQAQPRKRHLGLRILLILIVVALCVYVLPSPWAFHMGSKFSPLAEWDGYGPVQASNGTHYLLQVHLRGGILHNHGHGNCGFGGCTALTGTAQLCTQAGQRDTFVLSGAVHTWYSTNGARTDIGLTGGTPRRLPKGSVIAFHGVWHGTVLPITSTGTTFPTALGPAAGNGAATGQLRAGTLTGFARACRALAGHAH